MAGKLIGTGYIDVKGRNTQFTKSMDQNTKAIKKMGRQLKAQRQAIQRFNGTVKKMAGALKGAAAGLIAFAGVRGIKNVVKDMADFGAALYESSARLGVNTDLLQKWRRAIEGEGGSIEGADKALDKFVKSLAEARSEIEKGTFATGTYSENFRQLGITADEIVNLDLDQMLNRVADGMAGMGDQVNKAAVGMELFGQRGKAAINVLQDGSKTFNDTLDTMGKLGTISTRQAKDLKDLAQSFTDFGTIVRNAFAGVVAKNANNIRKAVQKLSEYALKLADVFDLFLEQLPRIKAYLTTIGAIMAGLFAKSIALATAAVWAQVGAWKALRIAMFKTGIGALIVLSAELLLWVGKIAEKVGGWTNMWKTVVELAKQAVDKMWNYVKWLWYKYEEAMLKIEIAMEKAFLGGIRAVFNFITEAKRGLSGFLGGTSALFKNWKDVLWSGLTFSGDEIKKIWNKGFEDAFNDVVEVGSGTIGKVESRVDDLEKRIAAAAEGAKNSWNAATADWIIPDFRAIEERIAKLAPASRPARPEPKGPHTPSAQQMQDWSASRHHFRGFQSKWRETPAPWAQDPTGHHERAFRSKWRDKVDADMETFIRKWFPNQVGYRQTRHHGRGGPIEAPETDPKLGPGVPFTRDWIPNQIGFMRSGHHGRGGPIKAPKKQLEEAKKQAEEVRNIVGLTNDSIAEGFTNFAKSAETFFENGKWQWDNFRNAGYSALDDIVSKFADRAIWQPFTDMMAGMLDDLVKGIGGQVSNTDGGGSFLANLFGSGKASGGYVPRGKPVMVGERGPELFTPPASGFVHSNTKTKGMGGAQFTFAPVINSNDKEMMRAEALKLMPQFVQIAKDEVIYETSRPGPLRTQLGY